jgi:hypothetical protein
VLSQSLEGEAVLLHLPTQRYFSLDSVGSRFWRLLEDDSDVERACARLLEEYDTSEETLRADLCALLEQLTAAGLVQVEA